MSEVNTYNRFYFVPYPINEDILKVVVQTNETARVSSNNIAFVKLRTGDKNNYKCLEAFEEKNQEQVDIEFQKDEWQSQ